MNEGPSTGSVIAGVFLILFGLCFLLVGGGCTILWIGLAFQANGSELGSAAPLVLLSVAVAAGGVALIVVGIRLFRPPLPQAPVSPASRTEEPPKDENADSKD